MSFLHALPYWLGVALLIAIGLLGLLNPQSFATANKLRFESPTAATEVRALVGSLGLGLGGMLILFPQPMLFLMAGVVFLSITLIRLLGLFWLDRGPLSEGLAGLVVDGLIGVLLASGYFLAGA